MPSASTSDMMFIWPDDEPDPILVNNRVRMSQGKMMGVDFNKDKTWVGSSIALHGRDIEREAKEEAYAWMSS